MTVEKKVNFIRKIANNNGINTSDIRKNTEISLTSARNVLEKDNITKRIKRLIYNILYKIKFHYITFLSRFYDFLNLYLLF